MQNVGSSKVKFGVIIVRTYTNFSCLCWSLFELKQIPKTDRSAPFCLHIRLDTRPYISEATEELLWPVKAMWVCHKNTGAKVMFCVSSYEANISKFSTKMLPLIGQCLSCHAIFLSEVFIIHLEYKLSRRSFVWNVVPRYWKSRRWKKRLLILSLTSGTQHTVSRRQISERGLEVHCCEVWELSVNHRLLRLEGTL